MKKLFRKSLLATVILTMGTAAGIAYVSNTLLTEDNSSDFSVSENISYNVLSENEINKNSTNKSYISAIKSNEAEIKSDVKSSVQNSYAEFKQGITNYEPYFNELTAVLPEEIVPNLPDEQPDDISDIVSWIETQAGQTLEDLASTISGIADIKTIPDSDFGKQVQALHDEYEEYFYTNVTSDDEYRTYWNDQDNTDFDGVFNYDPKSATWTDWTTIPIYFLDLMVSENPIPGQTFTSHKDVTDYYAAEVYNGFQPQLLVNSFTPGVIDPIVIDTMEPLTAEQIEEIINSFVDGNVYDHVKLPTIDIVVPYIPWTDIEHVQSIYDFDFFTDTPTTPYPTGEFATLVIDKVDEKVHDAVAAAMGSNTSLIPIVENSIHEVIDAPVATAAGLIETAYNAYINAVANIDAKITEFNSVIDSVNAEIKRLNGLIDVVNAEITAINTEIELLEQNINDALDAINDGLTVDWTEIENLVNGINGLITAINQEIDKLNVILADAVDLINTEIEKAFGELEVYFTYTNDTIAYIYESIWYYTAQESIRQLMHDHYWDKPEPSLPALTNTYADTTGNTNYHPPADGTSSMADAEFPFTEISITDDLGNTVVDTTNPIYTQTSSSTYSTEFTVAVREGGDFEDFDAENIKIYSSSEKYAVPTTEHTFTAVKNDVPLATGRTTNHTESAASTSRFAFPEAATYDVYEYTFTVNDLNAGEEYYFYMEANNFADAEIDAFFDGAEKAIRVNDVPVVHYMNNDVTVQPVTEDDITEVTAEATFNIQDDGYYWDIEEDDVQVVTKVSTSDDSGAEVAASDTTLEFTDGASGAPATMNVKYANLLPETEYETVVSVRPYDADDIQWISEDSAYVEQLRIKWSTDDWMDPQAPTITITDLGKPDRDLGEDPKHTRDIEYEITTPGADESIGQDTTVITSVDIYSAVLPVAGTVPDDKDYSIVATIPKEDITNNGGAAEAIESSDYWITGLELGTVYSVYFNVNFSGAHDTLFDGDVKSNVIEFTTEGLDPALPPYFGLEADDKDGFTTDETTLTTSSITVDFDFTDPMTPDTDTTNTIIESIDYYAEESSTGITEKSTPVLTADPGDGSAIWVDVVWDDGVDAVGMIDNNDTADINYTGHVTFNGLKPNIDYDFRMDLNSNAIPDIDSDPDSDKITISSPIATGKTLKLDALSPEWDATAPFEHIATTENTITFSYKFNVPENDLTHKNTFFDSIAVYYGPSGTTDNGLTTELSDIDPGDGTPYYVINPTSEGTAVGPTGETNGDYEGEVTFRNLTPNTEYTFQLGIKSHWYDDDYPTATPTDMPEIFSPIRTEKTAKLSAKGPWFDEGTGGLEFVDTSVVAPAVVGDENTIQARISYKFYLPPTDDDYYDTLFKNKFKIMLSSTYVSAREDEYEVTDFSVEQTTTGTITTVPEHTMIVTAEDGTEYTTTTTEGQMYSGIITLNNLHPEETYKAKMIVSTESANPNTDTDGNPVDIIDDIESNELSFDSHTLPPKKPYFGKEEDETDGISFVKNSDWSDSTISFDFNFTIPEKVHGYEQGIFNSINVYFDANSAALPGTISDPASALDPSDYTLDWKKQGLDNGDGTFGSGIFSGTLTFNGLDPNTEYFVQVGIDSNYYEGIDETKKTEVLSPIASGKTASSPSVEPEILSAEVNFDKDKSKFVLSMDVQTFNGESDPSDQIADTLIEAIHVGQIASNSSGDLVDVDGVPIDPSDPTLDLSKVKIDNADYYCGTGGYTVKSDENGEGVETVHYDINLLTDKIPFEKTINDMIITMDWVDDETSYDPRSGTLRYIVPEFTTPDIETITPQFESVYVSEEKPSSVDITYNIGLLDPSVEPNPDESGNSSYIDEPEIWQTETVIKRISVAEGTHNPLSSSSSKGLFKQNEPVDPGLPPVAPDASEAIYDSDFDADWEPTMFGTFTLGGLIYASTYSGVTIYAEYDAMRPNEVDDETATPVESGTIAFIIDPFETEWIETLTPEVDVEQPWWWEGDIDPMFPIDPIDPETVDPITPVTPGDKEEGVNISKIIWILLLVLFTAITIAAVLYPMIKND